MKFKKLDLADAMSEKASISKAEAQRQIENFQKGLELLVSKMEVGDKLQMVGFMTFEVVEVKERLHHNPKKPGEKFIVPAHEKLKVKVGEPIQHLLS